MPEYLSPGVYVEEISVGPKPIEGVATSNFGVVGPTERGPEDVRMVSSWLEFERLYGLPIDASHTTLAVKGFFDNGGRRCFVARVAPFDAGTAAGQFDGLIVEALGPGLAGNSVLVRISNARLPGPNLFDVTILYYRGGLPAQFVDPTVRGAQATPGFVAPARIEVYADVSAAAAAQNEVVRALAGSSLVRAHWDPAVPRARPQNTPAGATGDFVALQGGTAGAALALNHFVGEEKTVVRADGDFNFASGLTGLEHVDEVTLLAGPDEHAVAGLRDEVINQCERLADRFAVLSVDQGERAAVNIVIPRNTLYGALYWPWIRVRDPGGALVLVPPVGHVAGIMARTDIERGVHKPPANAIVRGAEDLEFTVTRAQQDVLNPRGINVIRDFRADRRGIRLWGARTIAADPEWKYVNVRRLMLFLEESIDEGTQWVVFEPNAEPLWDRVRRSIENFLITVWRNGALMGRGQEEAFYVKCDRTTMTQDDIDNGRLICYIGVAVVKPAEFVIFRIHQWTAGAETAV